MPLTRLLAIVSKRTVARTLLTQNCKVVLADRNEDAILKWTERLRPRMSGDLVQYRVVACDVTQRAQVHNLIQEADNFASNRIANFLVNCAGITRDNWVANLSMKDWDDVLDIRGRFTEDSELASF